MARFEVTIVLGVPLDYMHGKAAIKRQNTKSNLTLGSYREIKELDQLEEEETGVQEYYLGDNYFSASVHYTILENKIELTVDIKVWRDAFQVRLVGGGRPCYGRTVHQGPLSCVAFSVAVTRTLSTDSLLQLYKERCSIVVTTLNSAHAPFSSPAVLFGPRETLPVWNTTPHLSKRPLSSSSSSSTESTASSSSELRALRQAAPYARLQEARARSFPRMTEEAALSSERPAPFQQLFAQRSQVQEMTNEESSGQISFPGDEEGSGSSAHLVSEELSYNSATSDRPLGLDSPRMARRATELNVVPFAAHRQFCRRAWGKFQTDFKVPSHSKALGSQRSIDKMASQATHDTPASRQSPPSKASGVGSRGTRTTTRSGSAAGGHGSAHAGVGVNDVLPLRLEGHGSKFFSDMRAFYLQPSEGGDSKMPKLVQMNALVSASNLMNESQKAHLNPLMVHVTALYNMPAEILRVHGLERVLVRLRLPELDSSNMETAARGVEETVRFDESLAALTANIPNDRLVHHLNSKSLVFEVVGVRSKEWRPPVAPLVFGQAPSDPNHGTRPPVAAAGESAVLQAGACGLRATLQPPPEPEVLLAVACVNAAPLARGYHTRQFCQPLQLGKYYCPYGDGSSPEVDNIIQGWIAVTGDCSPGHSEFSGNLAYEGFSADPPANSSPLDPGDFIESASYLQVEIGLASDLRDPQRSSKTPADTAAGAGSGVAGSGLKSGPPAAGAGAGMNATSASSVTPNSSEAGFQSLLAVLWERRAAVRLAAAAHSINYDALGAFPPAPLISELAPQDPSSMLVRRSLRAPPQDIDLDSASLASLRHRLGYSLTHLDGLSAGMKVPFKSKKEFDFGFVAALSAATAAVAASAATGAKKVANVAQEISSVLKDANEPSKDFQVSLKPHEAVTGFIIDGIDVYYIFIEAPPGRSMQPFLQEAVTLRPEEGRLLYHSEMRSPTRLYGVFLPIGGILNVVLRSPLTEMLRRKPTTLLRGNNVAACWEALWRLDLLRRVKLLRQVLQGGLLPSPRALFSLAREYGVPLHPMMDSRNEPTAAPPPSFAPPPEAPPRAAARKVLAALWPHEDNAIDGVRPTEDELMRPGFGRRGRMHAVAHVLGALQAAPPSAKQSSRGAAASPAPRSLPTRPVFLCKTCKQSPPLPWILNTAARVPPPPVLPSFKKSAFKSLFRISNIEGGADDKLGRPFSVLEEETMWSERDIRSRETPLKPPIAPDDQRSHLSTRSALTKEALVSRDTDSVQRSSKMPLSRDKAQSKGKKSSSLPPSTSAPSIYKKTLTADHDSQNKKKSVEDAGDKQAKRSVKGKKSDLMGSPDTEVSERPPKGKKTSSPSTRGTTSSGIQSSTETSEFRSSEMKSRESASTKRGSRDGKVMKKKYNK